MIESERERETERERQKRGTERERQKERDRMRETERKRQKERDRMRETERKRNRKRDRKREREGQREREREKELKREIKFCFFLPLLLGKLPFSKNWKIFFLTRKEGKYFESELRLRNVKFTISFSEIIFPLFNGNHEETQSLSVC